MVIEEKPIAQLEDLEATKKEMRAQALIKDFFNEIGLPSYPEIEETPRRIVDLYKDMTEGLNIDIKTFFSRPLPTKHNQMIAFRGIEYVSMCEHHMWPFTGRVYIAYIPNDKIVGFSKFISAVRAVSRRPQLQERMTGELSEAIEECLKPKGSMVLIEGHHTCMCVGGRYDYGFPAHTDTISVTSMCKGVMLNFEGPRLEAMNIFYGGNVPHV